MSWYGMIQEKIVKWEKRSADRCGDTGSPVNVKRKKRTSGPGYWTAGAQEGTGIRFRFGKIPHTEQGFLSQLRGSESAATIKARDQKPVLRQRGHRRGKPTSWWGRAPPPNLRKSHSNEDWAQLRRKHWGLFRNEHVKNTRMDTQETNHSASFMRRDADD